MTFKCKLLSQLFSSSRHLQAFRGLRVGSLCHAMFAKLPDKQPHRAFTSASTAFSHTGILLMQPFCLSKKNSRSPTTSCLIILVYCQEELGSLPHFICLTAHQASIYTCTTSCPSLKPKESIVNECNTANEFWVFYIFNCPRLF